MSKKLYQPLLAIVVLIILILNTQTIANTVVVTNLEVTRGNLYGLFFLFLIEVYFLFVLYDFLVLSIYGWINSIIYQLCRRTLWKENVSLTQFMIRVNYATLRIYGFLKLGWVRYENSQVSPVWIGISKLTLLQKIIYITRVAISFPAILSIIFTLFTLKTIDTNWLYNQWKYFLELLKSFSQIEINFGDIFSRLPAVVALLTILPVFFFFYFYSQKREVRKIIDKKNKESFEIIVTKHDELSKLISKSIYAISENLDYIIKCQSLIIDLILNKKIKNFHQLENRHYSSIDSVESYCFKEIPEFDGMAELIEELTSEKLDYFTKAFSIKRYDLWHLCFQFYRLKTPDQLNALFFTKKGMEKKISNTTRLSFDCSEKEFAKYKDELKDNLLYDIYDALEMLYALKRYNDSLKQRLNSSSMEKTLIKIFLKEK